MPRYNKAAHEGRGTRAPEDTWPRVKGPLDLILFEGWMLGFQPVSWLLWAFVSWFITGFRV